MQVAAFKQVFADGFAGAAFEGDVIRHHHGGIAQGVDATFPGLVSVSDTLVNLMDNLPGHRLVPEILPEAVKGPLAGVLKESANWFPEVKRNMAAACDFFNKG